MRRSVLRLLPSSLWAPDCVFVINLDRRPDRWAAARALCASAGFPASCVERVSAVDGAHVIFEEAYRCGFVSALGLMRLRETRQHRIWGMDLNRGALGCALSHIHLWSRIAALGSIERTAATPAAARDKQCFLVIEDDSEIAYKGDTEHVQQLPHSVTLLERLRQRMRSVPADWELVYVSGLDTANQCPFLQVAEGVARVPQYHRTTNAYLVTPEGARRLLATCVPVMFQLDTVMTMRVGLPPDESATLGRTAVPYVLDPVCYTLQPPLLRQAERLGTDIQL